MVPCADNHGRMLRNGRRTFAGHPREPRADLLKPAQTTSRLGEPKMSRSRSSGSGFVGREYLRHEVDHPVFEGQS